MPNKLAGAACPREGMTSSMTNARYAAGRSAWSAAIMAALGTAQQSQAAQRVLVATEAGRGLYSTIGWSVHSHYSTVAITPPF